MRFALVGSGRCGTSLLRRLMNMHPQLWVHGETHWLPRMYEYAGMGLCQTDALLHIFRQTTHTNGERVVPVRDAELLELFGKTPEITVRDFAEKIGRFLAERHNKTIWADKTPDYGFFMQQIQTIWPDCKFIHLIRNGLDVAKSMSKHDGFQWILTSGEATWCTASFNRYYSTVEAVEHPVAAYAGRWCHAVNRIRDEATRIRPETYKEVFYEAILADPAAVLENIAEFVSIEPNGDWLAKSSTVINLAKLNAEIDKKLLASLQPNEVNLMKNLGYI
ncbi:MAG: sulfotransferase [Roseovarius sp.]